jgi:cytochrome c
MRVSVAVTLLVAAVLSMNCGFATAGNNNRAGVAAFTKYGCGSCHTISGVPGANGLVGPPLTGLGNRRYIAGELPNTPDNLTHWIQHPQSVNPRTAMPELGVTSRDSNDIATLLYASQ